MLHFIDNWLIMKKMAKGGITMGSFYSGFGFGKTFLGYCEDGIVYSGSGKGNPIGRYENGSVYNQFKEHVGSYSGGSIYNQFHEHIASYDNGIVYNKYLNVAFGKEQIGSYEDNPAEAAALVLLFLGGNAVNGDDEEKDTPDPAPSPTPPPSGDSDAGCLGAIFALLWGIISFVFVVLIPFLFVYIWLPEVLGPSWIGYLFGVLIILCASSGLLPLVYIFAIPVAIIQLLFYVYWLLVIIVKVKTGCSKKEMLKLFWKWFLKGPLAYPILIDIMNENNIMPKTTVVLKKLNNWFSNIFKKKTND